MIDLREQFKRQPFLMAPMAGVTDAAYRIMCRRRGAEMAYTEMVSVAGLSYKSAKTWVLVEPEPEEPHAMAKPKPAVPARTGRRARPAHISSGRRGRSRSAAWRAS